MKSLADFMELEAVKAQVAMIMKTSLEADADERIVDPAAERILGMLYDLSDIIDEYEHDPEACTMHLIDAMLHTLMLQDIMIEIQAQALRSE